MIYILFIECPQARSRILKKLLGEGRAWSQKVGLINFLLSALLKREAKLSERLRSV